MPQICAQPKDLRLIVKQEGGMADTAGLVKKLQIKPGAKLWLLDVPVEIGEALAATPDVTVVEKGQPCTGVVAFALDAAAVTRIARQALKALPEDGLLWVAYRKGATAKASGLNRDMGWEPLRAAGWDTVRSVSINDTWTGMRFRPNRLIKRQG